jgi:hypothetical protein
MPPVAHAEKEGLPGRIQCIPHASVRLLGRLDRIVHATEIKLKVVHPPLSIRISILCRAAVRIFRWRIPNQSRNMFLV